jgi:Bacterial dnaA  protein
MSQIALPFEWPVADRDEDFLISDANRTVYDHFRNWSVWPVMATMLTGPRKSGRSLLGRIFVRRSGGRLFDNAEQHDEEVIFHAWNEAQQLRRPLLIIADEAPPAWEVALPDLRSRLNATPLIRIDPPDDALLGALVVKLLHDRGVATPPDLAEYLVPRIERSYVAIMQIVDALDRAMLSHSHRLTVPMARSALIDAGLVARAGS